MKITVFVVFAILYLAKGVQHHACYKPNKSAKPVPRKDESN